MSAKELHRLPSSDALGWGSTRAMWRAKRRANERTGMAAHVAEYGVVNPVTLGHGYSKNEGPVIWEGHHRIDAAYQADPGMKIPVRHINVNEDTTAPPPKPVPGWDEVDRFPSYP